MRSKKVVRVLILPLIGLLVFACDKDFRHATSAEHSVVHPNISSTINGTFFSSKIIGELDRNDLTMRGKNLAGTGDEEIWIHIDEPKVGEFNLENNEKAKISILTGDNKEELYSTSNPGGNGTLNISTFDEIKNTISGTYSATLTLTTDTSKKKIIKNGVFSNVSCFLMDANSRVNSLKMDINESLWTGSKVNAHATTIVGYSLITVSGDNPNSNIINVSVSLESDSKLGRYVLTSEDVEPSVGVILKDYTDLALISGSIEITKNDPKYKIIEGTFNYKGKDTKGKIYTINNGSFSAGY